MKIFYASVGFLRRFFVANEKLTFSSNLSSKKANIRHKNPAAREKFSAIKASHFSNI